MHNKKCGNEIRNQPGSSPEQIVIRTRVKSRQGLSADVGSRARRDVGQSRSHMVTHRETNARVLNTTNKQTYLMQVCRIITNRNQVSDDLFIRYKKQESTHGQDDCYKEDKVRP